MPGGVLFDYAERCAVRDGGIEHIGNYGIEVNVGCTDIEIACNRITDIGAGEFGSATFFLGDRRRWPANPARTKAQGRHAHGPTQPAHHDLGQ